MKLSFLLLAAVLSAAACSSDGEQAPVEQRLLDRSWSLVSYTQTNGSEVDIIEGSLFQFEAASDTGGLSAQIDCNGSSGGSYQLGDGFIVLQFGAFTEVDCPITAAEGYAEQSASIDSLISQGVAQTGVSVQLMVELHEHGLVLTSANGRWLAFTEVDYQD